ncbi:riboflavin-binding protein-like [Varanus komodoensis]|uniref:Folate receptor-like domain-containing protein n=1 Tax=Varanus komodoensis TaxID=61221 RepID=A0A8D2J9L8_VARKO|nr:riboflavin-binding protein-like [Varanus komodoensis]
MLRFLMLLLFAILAVSINENRQECLKGVGHKLRPTQEKDLKECFIYKESSCCYAEITEELAHSPVIKVNTTYWNRCGNLSNLCESYMKKMECFYRCSPHTARWAHSQYAGAIQSVPICQSFCDDWYEACKNDLTCVSNWLMDWKIDANGENHCKNECISYSEMYVNGTDMCEKMWGESLKVSNSPCLCLRLNEMDNAVIKLMEANSRNSSSGRSDKEQDCHPKMELKQREEVEAH